MLVATIFPGTAKRVALAMPGCRPFPFCLARHGRPRYFLPVSHKIQELLVIVRANDFRPKSCGIHALHTTQLASAYVSSVHRGRKVRVSIQYAPNLACAELLSHYHLGTMSLVAAGESAS